MKHTARLATLFGVDSCRFIRFRTTWLKGPGSMDHQSWDKKGVKTTWLAERPRRRAGPWGIGCVFCASLMDRMAPGNREQDDRNKPEPQDRLSANVLQAYSLEMEPQASASKVSDGRTDSDIYKMVQI